MFNFSRKCGSLVRGERLRGQVSAWETSLDQSESPSSASIGSAPDLLRSIPEVAGGGRVAADDAGIGVGVGTNSRAESQLQAVISAAARDVCLERLTERRLHGLCPRLILPFCRRSALQTTGIRHASLHHRELLALSAQAVPTLKDSKLQHSKLPHAKVKRMYTGNIHRDPDTALGPTSPTGWPSAAA